MGIFLEIKDSLFDRSTGVNSPSTVKRLANINWILHNIGHLETARYFPNRFVKLVEVANTPNGERLCLQWPGIEATRELNSFRPFDFKPVVYRDNRCLPALSFETMWSSMEKLKGSGVGLEDAIRALATLLFRMAYMVDHLTPPPSFGISNSEVFLENGQIINETSLQPIPFGTAYLLSIPAGILTSLNARFGNTLCDMSAQAFLNYCDLLAWNEDVKYYYASILDAKGKSTPGYNYKPKWIGKTGRVNNLLTHVSFLGYTLGDISASKLFYKPVISRGVGAVTEDEAMLVCSPYINKYRAKML